MHGCEGGFVDVHASILHACMFVQSGGAAREGARPPGGARRKGGTNDAEGHQATMKTPPLAGGSRWRGGTTTRAKRATTHSVRGETPTFTTCVRIRGAAPFTAERGRPVEANASVVRSCSDRLWAR